MPSKAIALASVFVALGILNQVAAQNCACGFIDSNSNVWRESIVSIFTQNAGALAAVNANWRIASDPGTPLNNTGFTGTMQYISQNVFQWNDALGIKTSAYTGDKVIRTGEIDTLREDILYGTFRMVAQVPSVPGVVFGFFTYLNGTQEQDIEFLSSDPTYYQTVHYTNQPGNVNGNADPQATKDVTIPGADFTEFKEHRIDWLPTKTMYYFNQTLQTTITKNVPRTPSLVILNVWSNGDPFFSKGPPTQDAIATIQNVHLYFNSTLLSEAAFNTACVNAGRPAQCRI
ncbi:glycoside hydrolase family 16 protein [Sphaerobolus stellatus SS14]|uniref:Unplaced genomic scaffold SPHSTscaffold_146, whole genome shotgun sequence n=1 Tax=Sphaerobolus stellatus (strain SS14) TaxID=990650 RepID=A0A0C9V5R3_SPHS4|nr:glycoside hydrolase family 16 protein [Sphaerobolus stellatus SS14]